MEMDIDEEYNYNNGYNNIEYNDYDEYCENEPYQICMTSDGLEIDYYLNKPIEYLPPDTNIISFSDEYNQPVDNLPNQVDTIFFGSEFNHPVDDLPNGLKYIYFGQYFNQTLDNLPDTVEEIRVTQFYSYPINRLPKSLKVFNVVNKTKTILTDNCVEYVNEPHDDYYTMYNELEERFPHIQFVY